MNKSSTLKKVEALLDGSGGTVTISVERELVGDAYVSIRDLDGDLVGAGDSVKEAIDDAAYCIGYKEGSRP